ncbi:Predicted Zn-dependent peptidase [Microlunatus sagamiharensis]|uniref:Predicted Zn-dependent peptidase n=1 Tax=Microlunatus sagamiharensis TaxID=546874 RepID=A0A1H2MCC2_9ACTN|nr:pitrilysin family protein [Microlunatus sagamiharensis]SDU90581.1 Predicted Zn-dependent peptidase [Microlunatus sagamiharensis]
MSTPEQLDPTTWRAAPQPEVAAPGAWSFPEPVVSTLANGIELVCFDLPGQHVVSAHLVLDAPLNGEDPDVEGVATIAARTLDEGTRNHPGEEFAELLETEGAGFGIEVSLSGLQAVLDVPASHLEQAFALFSEAVTQPEISDADVARHVQIRLAQIEQSSANSAQLASTAFRESVFDPASRASRMSGGEAASVARVDGAAARHFHAEHLGPAGASLVLAGDFGGTDPHDLAQRWFGDWANDAQVRTPQEQAAPGARRHVVLHRPGAVQADVRYGGFGIDRLDPRWPAASVATYAMGGAFLSRLNAVLREEKGYTYGVRMSLTPLRSAGSFAIGGSFRTDVVADSVRLARELADVSGPEGRPFTAEEVADAVTYTSGISPLRYATADGVADQAAVNRLVGLGDDYVTRNLAELRQVTPEAATQAYTSLVDVDALTLVVVGDADVIADPLRDLGFDDLEVVRTEG